MTVPPLRIMRGTTNLIANPVAAENADGWFGTADSTVTRTTALPTIAGLPDGVTTGFLVSAHTTISASNAVAGFTSVTLTAQPHTMTAYIYIPASWSGGDIRLRASAFSGYIGTDQAHADMGQRDQWQRLAPATFTPASGDVAGSPRIEAGGTWNAGDGVYLTAVQIEPGTTPTPFTIGTRVEQRLPGFLKVGSQQHIGPLRAGKA